MPCAFGKAPDCKAGVMGLAANLEETPRALGLIAGRTEVQGIGWAGERPFGVSDYI